MKSPGMGVVRRYPPATQTIENQAAAATPLSIKGAAAQSAKLVTILDSTGAELCTVDASGTLVAGPTIASGLGISTGSAALELGSSRTGDGAAFIDLHASSGTDYEARIIRNSGLNGTLLIDQLGTGHLQVRRAGGVVAMTVDSSSRLGVGVVPSIADSILSLSKGISFPATASLSSDPNTLDDYEEGTWTPALTFATPGDLATAYTIQEGTYVKIGRWVFVTCELRLSTFTHTTASGNIRVTGLPFVHNTSNYLGGSAILAQGWTNAGAQPFTRVGSAASYVEVQMGESGTAIALSTTADWPTGGAPLLRFFHAYQTNS